MGWPANRVCKRFEDHAVNAAGVKLAREAREIAGVDCLVAGSMGPLAGVIDMDAPGGRAAIAAAHQEQAAILAGRGGISSSWRRSFAWTSWSWLSRRLGR